MNKVNQFEDLEIWQLSRELCNELYELSIKTGLGQNFKLWNQLDGSSGSVMDNIAEGFERGGNREFHNFLSIAKGSAGEMRSQLYRVYDRKFINEEQFLDLKNKTIIIIKKISALMNYIRNSDFKGFKFKES